MTNHRTFLSIVAVLGVLALVAVGARSISSPVSSNAAVFEQTWQVIADRYYDRDMNGLDWNAVRANYESRLDGVKDPIELYWRVLRPMTKLLESSHVQVSPPSQPAMNAGSRGARLELGGWNSESCAGVWITFGPQSLATRILHIDTDSYLHEAGVRDGWRLLGMQEPDAAKNAGPLVRFISTAGEMVDVAIPPEAGARAVEPESAKRDFSALDRLLLSRADPSTELRMESLGIRVSIGRVGTLPSVLDVDPGSEAARAGIQPGSTFREWTTKHVANGRLDFRARLRSPSGAEYAASFDYEPCELEQRLSQRTARMLPGDVLYLRFNRFEPGVIDWLDAELRARPTAIILDLRRNIGGQASVLLQVMGRFLEPGARIAEVTFPDHEEIWKSASAPAVFRGRMVVLVGPVSASAAELGASALKFHGRASLYGQPSSGSVLLSDTFALADGGAVQVATADVRGPAGARLEGTGVEVDRIVAPTLETARAGRDVAVESALAELAPPAPDHGVRNSAVVTQALYRPRHVVAGRLTTKEKTWILSR